MLLNLIILQVKFYTMKNLGGVYPANVSLFKVNKRNTSKKCEICPNLTIKAAE